MTKPISKTQLAKLATYTITHEFDDTPIEGNASAVDDITDRATNAAIRSALDAGNTWAWCVVTVTATYDGVDGLASLGACSYGSVGHFKRGGYYGTMRREALDHLHEQLIERDRKATPAEPTPVTVTPSWRQAIMTTYKGGKISVRAQAGKAFIAWDYELDREGNHAAAARQFAERFGWNGGQWVGGCLPDGHSYAWVLLPESMSDAIAEAK
jgi:hypothetical protein